jgi:hypothetical protein
MIANHSHVLYWEDCDKEGHEEGCYVAACAVKDCGWRFADCEEKEVAK